VYSSALTTKNEAYGRSDCDESNYYYYYEAIQVNVVETGYYQFGSNSNMDTYGYIYKNNFDPFNPSVNLLAEDDQSCKNNQFKLIIHMEVKTTYVLIVTTFYPSVTGVYSVFVSGANNVSFHRISEILYLFCA